jgi:ribosomal protein S18 acetylase RimI-like enzyme
MKDSQHTHFSIRPLTTQDEPFLWDMLYQAIFVAEGQARPPRSILEEPALAHYVAEWGQRPGDMGCLAVELTRSQPVGAAWLRVFSAQDPGYGFVDDHTPELSIAILPEYRSQGVGRRLLEDLLQHARGTFASVSLSVTPENPAVNLYHQLGFVIIAESADSITMLKRFAANQE